MDKVSVRYIVDDVAAAVEFYTARLDFTVEKLVLPAFAALDRGNLRLFLNSPGSGGAGAAAPDGRAPQPGGWSRFQVEVEDLAAIVEQLKTQGVRFRNELVTGKGGKQSLLEDPSGNVVELFEPFDH